MIKTTIIGSFNSIDKLLFCFYVRRENRHQAAQCAKMSALAEFKSDDKKDVRGCLTGVQCYCVVVLSTSTKSATLMILSFMPLYIVTFSLPIIEQFGSILNEQEKFQTLVAVNKVIHPVQRERRNMMKDGKIVDLM